MPVPRASHRLRNRSALAIAVRRALAAAPGRPWSLRDLARAVRTSHVQLLRIREGRATASRAAAEDLARALEQWGRAREQWGRAARDTAAKIRAALNRDRKET